MTSIMCKNIMYESCLQVHQNGRRVEGGCKVVTYLATISNDIPENLRFFNFHSYLLFHYST